MKKRLALLTALCMALALFSGCASKKADDKTELTVFAAASLNAALPEIAAAYSKTNSSVSLVFTFDSSGTLKTQIAEGAYCDIFISAGQKQMDAIDLSKTEANADGLDFVVSGTRFDLLENQIVLVVPAGNPAGISSFGDLSSDRLEMLAIGNSDVPVGQYAAEILEWLGIYDSLNSAGRLSFGTNTTEVTSQVSEGAVDAGIVYKTDVASATDPESLEIIAAAPEGSVSRAVYPAAVINVSDHQAEAEAFLEFLRGDEAAAILENYGFDTEF